jgi:hypothetical protein
MGNLVSPPLLFGARYNVRMAKRRKRVRKARMVKNVLARLVENAFDDDALMESLSALVSLIKGEQRRCREAVRAIRNDDHLQQVAYESHQFIDSILGCAFVLCQNQITAIVSRMVLTSHKLDINKARNKDRVLKIGTETIKTIAANIDLAANYFKHNDEWITTFKEKNGEREQLWDVDGSARAAQATMRKAISHGLKPSGVDNMQKLARLLGVRRRDYSDLVLISRRIVRWRSQLVRAVRKSKLRRPEPTLWDGV